MRPPGQYGQDQRVDHYQHRQQALDNLHSVYFAPGNSSASSLKSEPVLAKKEAYKHASSAAPIVAKDELQQQDNQHISASEMLPMLQCLFE